jgi:sigma-E factor negative regulatory protein RseC
MEEVGIIASTDGLAAKVIVPKKTACEGCTAGTCKPQDKSMEIDALNPVKAAVGQKVRVVMKPYVYLKGSIIVYGIPAAALIIGAVAGREIFSAYVSYADPDTVSAITGLGLCVLSFIGIKLWSRTVENRTEYKPVIEEILE